VFVDAGYLFAAGSILLCGKKLRRGEIRLTNEAGTDGPPTPKHIALAYESDVIDACRAAAWLRRSSSSRLPWSR
jgi:hypothetical protein